MNDENRTREQLVEELRYLRHLIHKTRGGDANDTVNDNTSNDTGQSTGEHPSDLAYVSERAEQRELMETMTKMFNRSPVSTTLTRLSDNVIVQANDTVLSLLEMDRESVVGRSAAQLRLWVDPVERDRLLASVMKQGHVSNAEIQVRTATGEIKIALYSAEIVEISGEPHLLSMAHDITERIQTEERLKTVSLRHKAILASVPDIIMEVDRNKRYIWANRAGLEFFGDDVIGKKADSYFEGVQDTSDAVSPIFDGHDNIIYVRSWQRRRDGEKRLLAWWCKVLKDLDGNVIGALSTARDVTEQQHANDALRASEEKLKSITSAAQDAIVMVNQEGEIVFWNKAATSIFGYTEEEANGQKLWTAVFPERMEKELSERLLTFGKSGLDTGLGNTFEWAFRRKNGEEFPGELSLSSLQIEREWHSIGIVRDITDRKRAEETIRSGEENLRSILNSSPDAITVSDLNGNIMECNQAAAEIHGFSDRTDMIGTNAWDLITPENTETAEKQLEQVRQSGYVRNAEMELFRRDGSRFPAELSVSAIRDSAGSSFAYIGITKDITDRKLAERELNFRLELESMLAKILTEFVNLPVADIDDSITKAIEDIGRFAKVDRSYIFLFSDDRQTISNTHEWCADGIEPRIGCLQGIPMSGFPWAAEKVVGGETLNCPDVSSLSSEASPERALWQSEGVKSIVCVPMVAQSEVLGLVGFNSIRERRDWSDEMVLVLRAVGECFANAINRKHAEEELVESEEKFRTYVNTAPVAILVVDQHGKYTDANEAACKMTGYSVEELLGMSVSYLADPEVADVATASLEELRETGRQSAEVRIRRKDGTIRLVALEAVALPDGRFVGFQTDITETRRLQELESRAQRLETAGQIAGQVAHDFNNMLAPLMAYPDLIRDELERNHPVLPYLSDIEKAAEQIAEINQQLLTLSRRGHYSQDVLNLNEIVMEAVRNFQPLPDTLKCDLDLCENLMDVAAGRAQIHRVISNLLNNARDAMQDIGVITITTENHYVDDVAVSYERIPKGEYVRLTVCDTGNGIPEDVLQKIFDPFFTTKSADKKRGSGLGLSVVDAVLKDHNGYIDLNSKVGEGTSFHLYFPITREKASDRSVLSAVGGTEKILVVDDDKVQREVSTKLLKSLGYRVNSAESGEEAIELLGSTPHDLMILDMIMPGGIDGTKTYQHALEINPVQKAIVISGFAESKRVEKALRMGAGAFIKKPLTRSDLAAAVRRELDANVKKAVH